MRLRRIPQAKNIIKAHPLVLTEEDICPGKWREYLSIPPGGVLNLEIGMGRGRFITAACFRYSGQGWLGLEIREEMILKACRKLKQKQPANLRFLWLDAVLLDEAFTQGEVDHIYLSFSDPWPKARHAKRRLTHQNFLKTYKKILSLRGDIVFKTDNRDFFFWSKEGFLADSWQIVEESWDLPCCDRDMVSEYEERFRRQGMPVYGMVLKKVEKEH